MSWLEAKWIREINGNDRLFVAAVTSEGVVGVQYSGAIAFVNVGNLTGWVVEEFHKHAGLT